MIIGSLLGGDMADFCGRRLTLICTVLLLISGPLIMALAQHIWVLLVGRCIVGIGMGCGLVTVTMYIAELGPAKSRGRFVACQEVALNIGLLLGYFSSWLLVGRPNDWRWMIALGAIIPMLLAGSLLILYVV